MEQSKVWCNFHIAYSPDGYQDRLLLRPMKYLKLTSPLRSYSGQEPISSSASRVAVAKRWVSWRSTFPPGMARVLLPLVLLRVSSSAWPPHLDSQQPRFAADIKSKVRVKVRV